MPSVRSVLDEVGDFYGMRLTLPQQAGYGTALGALYSLAGEHVVRWHVDTSICND
jgi:hypothetical protein